MDRAMAIPVSLGSCGRQSLQYRPTFTCRHKSRPCTGSSAQQGMPSGSAARTRGWSRRGAQRTGAAAGTRRGCSAAGARGGGAAAAARARAATRRADCAVGRVCVVRARVHRTSAGGPDAPLPESLVGTLLRSCATSSDGGQISHLWITQCDVSRCLLECPVICTTCGH